MANDADYDRISKTLLTETEAFERRVRVIAIGVTAVFAVGGSLAGIVALAFSHLMDPAVVSAALTGAITLGMGLLTRNGNGSLKGNGA